MKVKSIAVWQDLKENVRRKSGEEFEVTKERFKEIEKFVTEIKEVKKKDVPNENTHTPND